MFELPLLGIFVGFLSGFFGVGGGMILIIILLYLNFSIKEAISISILQMVFSSLYGSFLNFKKAKKFVKDGIIIGLGGFIGGLQSGFVISNVSDEFLELLLISILIFSIIKIYQSKMDVQKNIKKQNTFALIFIGFLVGIISTSAGVGGSLILAPILISFLKYDIKSATALGLFFVFFSSIAGFVSLSFHGKMLYEEGLLVAIFSLLGVYFGIQVKKHINQNSYKQYILALNIIILINMLIKFFDK